MKNYKFISVYEICLLLLAVTFNFLVYGGGRWIARTKPHVCMGISLDEAIPLIPCTVYLYLGCYLFWTINYILAVRFEKRTAGEFIAAHLLGETICFLAFVFLPTTMERPVIAGNNPAEELLLYVYRTDAADNLFPSIHCFVSWMSWIGVRRNYAVPRWYRICSLLLASAVCVTVLTVKQHVLADVLAGVLLAELSYVIVKHRSIDPMKRFLQQMHRKFTI